MFLGKSYANERFTLMGVALMRGSTVLVLAAYMCWFLLQFGVC